ncbi:plasmid mobilization protein [Blautia massiliensis (ex Durand et al. 2017)]|uniref:plasmid mobilization protein n=1 Tax=Blautia massiliensis (ex Durand et al. 2017) TaxID=1737424 RepID=UPI0024203703|nr:hypothetical protein [Blautia massiliensis (ex Durand et al. 2017)]
MVTRKRNHRMTCRLNDEEYEKVLIKISKSGLSKQEYILSCILNKRISEKLDLDFYKLINEINHVGNNLNQISRILNSKNPILENEVLENQRMVNAVLTNLNHQIKGAGNGNN